MGKETNSGKPKGNVKPVSKAPARKVTSAPKKLGRPSDFTQELADLICERLSDGESLRSICQGEEMPNKATVFRWLAARPDFSDQYARAREVQAETMADDILQIADDGANDTYVDENGNKRTDHDVIARSKLRVDARKWLASKMAPKRYGDKVDVNHGGQADNPLSVLLQQVSGKALPIVQGHDDE